MPQIHKSNARRPLRRGARSKRKSMSSMGPAPGTITYRGPINAPDSVDGNPILLNLSTVINASATASAAAFVYTTVFNVATFTGLTDFSDAAALYQEFRCLAIQIHFVPSDQGALTPYVGSSSVWPLTFGPYHGDATAFTDIGSAYQHTPNVFGCVNQPLSATVKMLEADEAQWFSTTSGTAPVMGIKSYFAATTVGSTDTISFGTIMGKALFQFRGRVRSATQMSLKTSPSQPSAEKKVAPLPTKESKESKDSKESIAIDEGYVLPKPVLSRESSSFYTPLVEKQSVPKGKSVAPSCKIG